MIVVLHHSSPKNVLCTRIIKGVDGEPFSFCDLSQSNLKQTLPECKADVPQVKREVGHFR